MTLNTSRYDGVGIGDAGKDVFLFEVRVVVHEFLVGGSLAQQAQDEFDGDPHVPDDWLAVEDVGAGGDSLEEVLACGGHVGAPVLLIGCMLVPCASVVNCWGVGYRLCPALHLSEVFIVQENFILFRTQLLCKARSDLVIETAGPPVTDRQSNLTLGA